MSQKIHLRKLIPLCFLYCLLLMPGAFRAQDPLADTCRLQIGTNISGPADYGSEWPFIDIMKHARTWGTQNIVWVGGGQNPWDSQLAETVARDANGYPLEVPFEAAGQDTTQIFYTVWANTESMPSGVYTCRYEGTGRIVFDFDGQNIEEAPGLVRFRMDAGMGDILIMKILESKQGDHIRNIRIYLPGYDEGSQSHPFENAWLEKLSPFSAIRFMDWGYTNNQEVSAWEDRSQPGDYCHTQKTGIPYEYWIQLCNLMQKDAWICIPHRADGDFIDSLALLFRDGLDPGLRLYVEYTNEYWNWIFSQAHYVHDSLDQNLNWPERYAPRLAEVMQRFSRHFSGTASDRLVRVFATQHAWWDLGWRVMDQLELQGDTGLIDAISIAGYMGIYTDSLAMLGAAATADDVIRLGRSLSFDPSKYAVMGWEQHAMMAQRWDKQLLFYEGGQHFTPEPFGTVQPYGPALVDAQFHPGMYDLYNDLLALLRRLSDEEMLFMNFSFIAPSSEQYGSWGALTHQFDEQAPYPNAPKYRALLDNIFDCEQSVATRDYPGDLRSIAVVPNPAGAIFHVKNTRAGSSDIRIHRILDMSGRALAFRQEAQSEGLRIELEAKAAGMYFIQGESEGVIFTKKIVLYE